VHGVAQGHTKDTLRRRPYPPWYMVRVVKCENSYVYSDGDDGEEVDDNDDDVFPGQSRGWSDGCCRWHLDCFSASDMNIQFFSTRSIAIHVHTIMPCVSYNIVYCTELFTVNVMLSLLITW